VHEVPLRVGAGRVHVEPAVAVEVSAGPGHAVGARLRARLPRHVEETPSAVVVVQVLQAEVVGDQEVGEPVAVVVGEEPRERPARHAGETPGPGRVREAAVPVVQIEVILAPVVGVVRRVGHLAVVVAGHADEEIQVPVAVHVGERGLSA
jgi:hypothetical protein